LRFIPPEKTLKNKTTYKKLPLLRFVRKKKIHTYLIPTLPENFNHINKNPKNFARHIDYAAATLKKRSLKTNTITGQFI
jgi:hypothetical protein